jgi:acetyl esterase/lipase
MGDGMPLDPQFRAILDTLDASGLLPLVREDAAASRAHYRQLALSRRGPDYVPEPVASVAGRRSPGGVPVRVCDLAGVAPAIVATAEFDPLRDEGTAYAGRLADAGCPPSTCRAPGSSTVSPASSGSSTPRTRPSRRSSAASAGCWLSDRRSGRRRRAGSPR